MFQSLKDNLSRVWQGRFRYGISVGLGGANINRYANGAFVIAAHGPNLASAGTGHWAWFLFEAAVQTGPRSNWHAGLLGYTLGKLMIHTLDKETGEVVGPDKSKYYFFFKGINNQHKDLMEIIT